jgi:hypothetical protein
MTLHPTSPAAARAALAVAIAGAVALAAVPAGAEERGTATPEAAALAAEVMAALGGAEAWQEARFLRFGFAGRRSHAWDRATGLHRVEGETPEGEPYLVIHDLDSREGRAWVAGEPAAGARLTELLENAHGAWVNDTYWLLMPYKLRDPGVTLAHDGRREIDGSEYEVLTLSFAGVGLTPGDRYWVYVDPATHLVAYWAYHLESMEPEAEPVMWRWEGWRAHGGIQLAARRAQVGTDRVLELAPIEVAAAVPPGAFDPP